MDIEEQDFPCFEVIIEQDNTMKQSVFIEGQQIYFPKEDLIINNSGIAKMSNPNSKMDRIKIKTKYLQECETLGSGSTAVVRRAIYKEGGNEYVFAVKSINAVQQEERKQLLNDLRENIFGGYCEHMVQFYTCFFKNGLVKQVIEYMDMGTLKGIIKLLQAGKLSLSEAQIATIMEKILLGLHNIHTVRKSIHRDIKPENILINSKGNIKITDFGVSKCIQHSTGKSVVGSISYMSPQMLSPDRKEYSYTCDIWSVGIVMYELATTKNPYADAPGAKVNYFKTSLKVLQSPPPELPAGKFSPAMADFLKRCLVKNDKERASTETLLNHPWIIENKLPSLMELIEKVRQLS